MTDSNDPSQSTLPFLVFSDDWGVHPSSSQHIFRHISERHPVAWINTVGMRRPKLSLVDARKAISKAARMFRPTARPDANAPLSRVHVCQPTMIPFNDINGIRRLNGRFVKRAMSRIVSDICYAEPVVVTTVPNACDYVDAVPNRRVVYYCVDDFSEWPGLDKKLVLSMEAELVAKADVFIATSPQLFERLARTGKPTHLLSHGVDIEMFSAGASKEHEVLAGIPSPRAGYFGLFDERSDQDLIAEVARQTPNVSFVIAGRVETSTDRLRELENVYFVGPIDYTQLPALIKGLSLLFIPYVVNALSDALSPLKFKEYLATARPIISTPIAAASEFEDCIFVTASAAEWSTLILQSIEGAQRDLKDATRPHLEGQSWQDKAFQFVRWCSE